MTEFRGKASGGFKSLEAYQRAYALALTVHRASLGFPKIEQFALADQMRRCSKSVCANVAEGFGRQRLTGADWKRFLMMAVGSADEMQVWCAFAADLDYLDRTTAEQWEQAYVEIARMLHGLMKSWDARA